MPAPLYPRHLFGASAILFAGIALRWHDADTWQTLTQLWRLPLGALIGASLMLALIIGALAIQIPKTARPASILLAAIFLLFSLACVPPILADPATYYHYGSFFEQFTCLCGAIALYAAATTNAAQARTSGRIARLGLGLCATSFTLSQILYFQVTADLVPKWIPPTQALWAILTTIAFGLAAIAILLHRQTRLALRLMTLMLALFGILVWIPRLIAHPESHGNWSEFALTALITGAVWMVADSKSL